METNGNEREQRDGLKVREKEKEEKGNEREQHDTPTYQMNRCRCIKFIEFNLA